MIYHLLEGVQTLGCQQFGAPATKIENGGSNVFIGNWGVMSRIIVYQSNVRESRFTLL